MTPVHKLTPVLLGVTACAMPPEQPLSGAPPTPDIDVLHVTFPSRSCSHGASAVALACFAPSVGMPTPRPQRRRVVSGLLPSSLNQPLVGEPLMSHAIYERIEPCKRVPFHVAIVQAERELVRSSEVETSVIKCSVLWPERPEMHDVLNRSRCFATDSDS
jgi:hypothetical protein